MSKFQFLLLFFLSQIGATAQTQYGDYYGAGHNVGITVITSSNATSDTGDSTVDGFPVNNTAQLNDASRFLAQATLGASYEEIQALAASGYEAWLDAQMSLPQTSVTNNMLRVMEAFPVAPDIVAEFDDALFFPYFRSAWWETVLRSPDVLRHRVTLAMSEFFVISHRSDLFEDWSQSVGTYYDMLGKHAFGNYRDLLLDIALNPCMGVYLSHYNNPKTDVVNKIRPDENFAREIMQLFSIGLHELNNDGTRKLDTNGNPIPTYNNDDIKEFAKIFTGLTSGLASEFPTPFEEFLGIEAFSTPMQVFDSGHEPGVKKLLNGQIVPAGQMGMKDINDAIDNLYNHPNTGPFIGRKLIQFLTTSNPSPAYVNRVANAFNDNGAGVRGDMKAIIRAILLDPEARDCNAIDNPTGGKLREPIVRRANYFKAFNAYPAMETFFSTEFDFISSTGQFAMYSPSVFNFFLPDYQPNGDIADADLFAPEFQIHNSSTAIGYVNQVHHWGIWQEPMYGYDAIADTEFVSALPDFSAENALVNNPTALVERLNTLLCAGQLSDASKAIIINTLNQMDANEERAGMAMYLIMLSPDYVIIK